MAQYVRRKACSHLIRWKKWSEHSITELLRLVMHLCFRIENIAADHEMLRRHIRGLGPYQSLALLAIPTSLVEPLKIFAVAIAGAGHWIAGTITIVCAYGVSLLLVERLFEIVKPKLLTLPWFARLWNWFVSRRDSVLGWIGRTLTFDPSVALDDPPGCKVHPDLDFSPTQRPLANYRER